MRDAPHCSKSIRKDTNSATKEDMVTTLLPMVEATIARSKIAKESIQSASLGLSKCSSVSLTLWGPRIPSYLENESDITKKNAKAMKKHEDEYRKALEKNPDAVRPPLVLPTPADDLICTPNKVPGPNFLTGSV